MLKRLLNNVRVNAPGQLGGLSSGRNWAAYFATRYTSDGKTVVNSSSQVTLYWTNNGVQDYDSISILGSTDNSTFTEYATAAVSATSKAVTGLDFTNDYYFRIVYVKSGHKSTTYASPTCLSFILPVTTTGAQTLTLDNMDVATAWGIRINWGDTNADNYTGTGSRTHAYAGAGSYTMRVINARGLTFVNMNDAKLAFNSNIFLKCGDNLASISLSTALVSPVVNSADMAHLHLTYRLSLYFPQTGTYTIDSSHFSGYSLTYELTLSFPQTGTYTIDSSHFSGYNLTYQLYLYFPQIGTYTIDSSHFSGYSLTSLLSLSFPQIGTYTIDSSHFSGYALTYRLLLYFNTTNLTKTIARGDFDGFPALPTIDIEMGLTQAESDAILFGLYDGFAAKTVTGGTVTLAGNGNAAPSGTYQSACPPTSGKEAQYDLINDPCDISSKHYSTITTA